MSMKKGYCFNCNTRDETRRIFDVNSDVKYCYCPRCMKKYRPKVVIHNYERVIHHYLRRANFFLKNAGEPKLAYSLFAYILELEPTNRSAKLGRMLSLAYISTLRRNRFNEVKELLMMEKDLFKTQAIRREYISFLTSLDHSLNTFLSRAKKKLMFKGYYYELEGFKLYLKHINEAIILKRIIISELISIDQDKLISPINNSIKDLEGVYKKSVITVKGEELHLANFSKDGEPLITTNKKKEVDPRVLKYRMSTLDPNNKKLRLISDSVFSKRLSRLYFAYRLSLLLTIIFGVLAITSFVTFFITMKYAFSVVFIILAILLGVTSLLMLAFRFVSRMILKKPRI